MSRPDPFPRLVGVVALVWGLLVWINWFDSNPLSFRHVWAALADYRFIEFIPALRAWGRHLISIACVIVLGLAALGAGRPVIGWLRGPRDRRFGFAAVAVGAGVLSLMVLAAGFNGLLFSSVAWTMVGSAVALALFKLRSTGFASRVASARARLRGITVGQVLLAIVILLGLWLALLGALAPPISFDTLVHHFGHPQIYAAHHKVVALPHHFLSEYPAILEMQYLLAWLVGGGAAAAKLIHYAWGIFALAVLGSWAREWLSRSWALAAMAALVLIPYVQLVMMWGYVDLGAAGYLTLTMWAVCTRPVSPALVGVLCGLCAGTKATGVFAPVLAGAVLVARRSPRGTWVSFVPACFLVALPWGAKNFAYTGNPFAPFLANLIPTLLWGSENIARYQQELRSYEVGHSPVGGWPDLVAYPWRASVRNLGVLDQQAGMGAWFVWLFPLLLFIRSSDNGRSSDRLPALLSIGYFLLWMLIPRQVRYLLPIWPVAMLACALALRDFSRRGGLALISLWAAGFLLFLQLAMAFQRQHSTVNSLDLVFGNETRDEYLSRGLPGKPFSVVASRWVRENLTGPGRVLILGEFGLGLYWGPGAIFQSVFDTSLIERFARETRDSAALAKRFRQAGVTRALYSRMGGFVMQATYHTFGFDAASGDRWRRFWQGRAKLERRFSDRFLLYRIDEKSSTIRKSHTRVSTLPGLNEQWLGEIDFDSRLAEQADRAGGGLPGIAARYREVAEREDSSLAYERLGITLLQMGQSRKARRALRKAERLGRRSALLEISLGVLASEDARLSDAIKRFRGALALDPGLIEARRNLVLVLWQLNDRRGAVDALRRGLELDPKSKELRGMWMQMAGESTVPSRLR